MGPEASGRALRALAWPSPAALDPKGEPEGAVCPVLGRAPAARRRSGIGERLTYVAADVWVLGAGATEGGRAAGVTAGYRREFARPR